jgi:hypothetical protein
MHCRTALFIIDPVLQSQKLLVLIFFHSTRFFFGNAMGIAKPPLLVVATVEYFFSGIQSQRILVYAALLNVKKEKQPNHSTHPGRVWGSAAVGSVFFQFVTQYSPMV